MLEAYDFNLLKNTYLFLPMIVILYLFNHKLVELSLVAF
jgi:glycopeptide antibiotics resistance protein